jgi:hypothetical protein
VFFLGVTPAEAANGAVPGEIIVQPPTLICLGFQWMVEGDEDRDSSVSVRFRKQGGTAWRDSMPLYRVGGSRAIPHSLVGSILDLDADTAYEVRLEMQDPDGVRGEAVKTIVACTRAIPKPIEGGPVRHVYPETHKGKRATPAYRSIVHAINGFHPWCDDYDPSGNHAQPGDTILVHGGVYGGDRFNYRDYNVVWLHGTQILVHGGEEGRPIAIVAAGDGEVIVDGATRRVSRPLMH